MPTATQIAPAIPPMRTAFAQAFEQSAVVFRNEFKYLLASARTLVSMAIYGGFASLSVWGYIAASDKARAAAAEKFGDKAIQALDTQSQQILANVLDFSGWSTSSDAAQADAAELFRDHVPLLVIFFFALSSFFLPLLVALVSFDQFSELSTRGARFALLRVRRASYMAGKVVASVGAVAAFLLVMWSVVAAVTVWRDGVSTAPQVAMESARAWALMVVLALPYLSLTAFVSSLARPVFSFILTLAALVAMGIGGLVIDHFVPWMLRSRFPTAAENERALLGLLPWRHAPQLLSRDFGTMMGGVGALLLIAAGGYAATYAVVRSRDV